MLLQQAGMPLYHILSTLDVPVISNSFEGKSLENLLLNHYVRTVNGKLRSDPRKMIPKGQTQVLQNESSNDFILLKMERTYLF